MKYYLRKKFCTKLQAKLPTRMRAIIQQTAGGSADQLTISEVPMPVIIL